MGRKVVGTSAARAAIKKYIAAFDVIPIDATTLNAADALAGADFEDNILIAAAVSASLDAIVTRNLSDFQHASIPVHEPAALLVLLRSMPAAPNTNASS